jgi:hypothetical protein
MIEPPHSDDDLGSPRLGIFVCDMVAGARFDTDSLISEELEWEEMDLAKLVR